MTCERPNPDLVPSLKGLSQKVRLVSHDVSLVRAGLGLDFVDLVGEEA